MTPVDIAYPVMKDLVSELREWCSLALLAPPDIVYIARVHSGHILSIAGGVGSRLPAHATATGRVLLAGLRPRSSPSSATAGRCGSTRPTRSTTASASWRRSRRVRQNGWALVDQELELGLRGIAAPVLGADGRTFAGLSVSTTAARLDVDELRRALPAATARRGADDLDRPAARRRRRQPRGRLVVAGVRGRLTQAGPAAAANSLAACWVSMYSRTVRTRPSTIS